MDFRLTWQEVDCILNTLLLSGHVHLLVIPQSNNPILVLFCSVIIVSELGDKTFFIAAIMAMRHARVTVFSGAIAALGVMHVSIDINIGLGDLKEVILFFLE